MKDRHSIRLKSYDYTAPGWYFVTVCTHQRKLLFGEIEDGKMTLNSMEQVVYKEWINTPKIRENIELDQFVIMPNHLHGIIVLDYTGRGTKRRAPTEEKRYFRKPIAGSLSTIIGAFKSAITKQIHRIKPDISIWQRNFYEHIIRNDKELSKIRKYIMENPLRWELDRSHPQNMNNKFQEKTYV